MEKEIDKYCGNCCWFCHEDTDGWGFCNTPAKLPKHVNRWFTNCEMPGGTDCGFVSRKEMRHHMAVLLQAERWYSAINDTKNYNIVYMPNPTEYRKAIRFAYKYMKVFSNL